jgi:hypothetical protein
VTLRLSSGSGEPQPRSGQVPGINYPWTVFQGRPNYGCDFGRNRWNSHTGVTAHLADVRADFEVMAGAGVEVTRWFAFTDGRGGLAWNAAGTLVGLDDKCLDDFDAALEIATAAGIRVCLVLIDFTWLDDPARRAALESDAFVDRVLDPLLDRYGKSHAIHSFDLINEPDWRDEWPADRLRAYAGEASRRIHLRSQAFVTLGGALVRNARRWDDQAYGLDVIQVHSYPDVRYQDRDQSVFEMTAADFHLTKPLLIGECPWDPRSHPEGHLSPAHTLHDYLDRARDAGYLGAWPWSFKGVDAFGAVDMTLFASRS